MAKETSPKHKVNEKSLANLKKFTPGSEHARECQKKSTAKRIENMQRYYSREDARAEIFKEILKQDKITEAIAQMSPRELIELLKTVLPPEKITQEIIGSLGIEKVFVKEETTKETDNHIDSVLNE